MEGRIIIGLMRNGIRMQKYSMPIMDTAPIALFSSSPGTGLISLSLRFVIDLIMRQGVEHCTDNFNLPRQPYTSTSMISQRSMDQMRTETATLKLQKTFACLTGTGPDLPMMRSPYSPKKCGLQRFLRSSDLRATTPRRS